MYSVNPGGHVLFDWLPAPDSNDPDEMSLGLPERDSKWSAVSPVAVGCLWGPDE